MQPPDTAKNVSTRQSYGIASLQQGRRKNKQRDENYALWAKFKGDPRLPIPAAKDQRILMRIGNRSVSNSWPRIKLSDRPDPRASRNHPS